MDEVKNYPPYLDYPKPHKALTNAQKIRAMSDEELAEWMSECNAYRENAIASQWLPWLQEPCEGG